MGEFFFHSGLLVVILSSFYTVSFQKRGFIQLIEGETYRGDEESLLVKELGVLAKEFVPGFNMRLLRFEDQYWEDGTVKELDSLIELKGSGEPETVQIGVNATASYGGVSIYQARSYGYTLVFFFADGKKQFIVRYNVDSPGRLGEPYIGFSDIPLTHYNVKLNFYPDRTGDSFYLNEPSLELTVEGSVWEEPLYSGTISPGQTVALPGGALFTWTSIGQWSGIRLVDVRSTPLVFAGFALICIGLIMLYIIPRRSLR